ncbi:MAG: type II toxin-antitoxin system VapC family toxin [Nitrospirae bacterium]|nr:type II toxin-antitoxin system VapC family toxin [Nitrospirota bacterium]
MITAIDTNILLDILIPDESHFLSSKNLLDEYIEKGQLIICEIVYAELASQFIDEKEIRAFLSDTGIRLVHSNEKTLYIAGERWRDYAKNRRAVVCRKCRSPIQLRQRVVSDFIVGAHALVNANLLLSRDRGFYRAYFKDLKVGG